MAVTPRTRERFALAAYGAATRLIVPAIFVRYYWRGRREPGYRMALAERLGCLAPLAPGSVWVHSVSLGETKAAAALVDALRERLPGMRLLLTHGTATGREAGRALLREGDVQAWLPLDTPGAVRRFFERARPALGVLMETEVWPQLLAAARTHGVPMVLANARLSEKSARQGERFASLMRPAAAIFDAVLAQSEDDAVRLRAAGGRDVVVCGNLKFDVHPSPALVERGRAWRAALGRPVVLAAITREGEEAMLLEAWGKLSVSARGETTAAAAMATTSATETATATEMETATTPSPAMATVSRPLLLVVPRHPQRFDEVHTLMTASGLRVARRSGWADVPAPDDLVADAWLGDSLGEMPLYYGVSDVALLGGSFAPLGGHNLIEAAACGCPIVVGPSTFNFAEAARQAIEAGAAWRDEDIDQALRRALSLLGTYDLSAAGFRARDFATRHRGAATRMVDRIAALAPRG
jgi:3-deoxy-D-manno-octulosonic-acid transferase